MIKVFNRIENYHFQIVTEGGGSFPIKQGGPPLLQIIFIGG
jgi:hypothetical protein